MQWHHNFQQTFSTLASIPSGLFIYFTTSWVVRYLGVLVNSMSPTGIPEHCKLCMFQLMLLDQLIFCVIVSITLRHWLNLLYYPSHAEKCLSFWHPQTTQNINTLESVQHRVAHWASKSKWNAISPCWSKPSNNCIQELHWPIIWQRHNYYSICW